MKLGILTFHAAHNYGAVLQAYGLLNYLSSLGHEVYVIDYRPDSIRRGVNRGIPALPKNPLKLCKTLVEEFSIRKDRLKRFDKFEEFIIKELNLFPFDTVKLEEFDRIFIGSDQVWNKSLLNNKFDPVYMGASFSARYVSYAASMGWYQVEDDDIAVLKQYLSNFEAISVRETDTSTFLTEITGTNIHVTCDPTLLLKREEWTKLYVPTNKKGYVLCYNLLNSNDCQALAEDLAKSKGLEIINLVPSVSKKSPKSSCQSAGPKDFISYIMDAEYVVTSSFHGTVFSILFDKEFYSVGLSNYGGRIRSLLRTIGLEDRMIVPKDLNNLSKCDYMAASCLLNGFITESKNFIKNSL